MKIVTPIIRAITIIKTITAKITTNDKSNNKNKNKQLPKQQQQKEKNKVSTIYPKIFVLKTYQSYKNTDAQHIGNKTARHFLQY